MLDELEMREQLIISKLNNESASDPINAPSALCAPRVAWHSRGHVSAHRGHSRSRQASGVARM